ncbi:nitrate reductase molybdenum cofactor assembly chaperone [Biformimicrobium ophioploci]|uniref:Nitrate reductase molybdenum cofactor assembly chaperone n=1 Tax=Biformimicrobium ophioploci TaxID=3036711 RepID=A0ABQ6M213_9GAMM|nr:nitrate reductase molybdenum cofactor assembly chaperone [Microbulbifer sp. NKW57]GMG88351.1 nitrate reductase molybdenum cofactor assembly chaperone [Microbulbifer sp. NKW57]
MKSTLRALAMLLSYPGGPLKTHIAELRQVIETEPLLKKRDRAAIMPLLQRIEQSSLLDLQIEYSGLFDSSRALSLHVFEHIHGESRERGQAMINLGEEYAEHGFYMVTEELPDFIPLFLEFVSCLPIEQGRDWLSHPAHVFVALEERLKQRDSDYAGVFQLLTYLAGDKPDMEAVQELLQRERTADTPTADEEWEEKPVTFSAPPTMQPESGLVSRLKAAGKLIVSSSDN